MKKKVRSSNFELLRIISMFMIILHHYSYHGGSFNLSPGGGKYVSQLLFVGGSVGVTLFMMISSYFLVDTKFSIKRILRVWFEIFLYNAVIGTVCYFLKLQTFTYKTWLQVFMPIVFNATWFGVAYIFMCFISPFLNRMVNSLTQKSYAAFLVVLFVFFSLIPTVTFVEPQRVCFNLVSWFVCIYLFMGYIRRFSFKVLDNKIVSLSVFIISILCIWGSEVLFTRIGISNTFFAGKITFFTNHDNMFNLFAALSLFMFFKNLDLGSNKVINAIARTAFGVYLIHDNIFMRMTMWRKWLNASSVNTPGMVFLHGMLAAVIIYALCSLIDWIRIICIEQPLFSIKKFDSGFEKIDNIFMTEEK